MTLFGLTGFLCLPLNASDESSEFGDFFEQDLPVVLSATRLKQPKSETPAAVTVITQDTIAKLGVRTLAEVFRLVPGMYVGYERGHQPEVGYHTLAGENSRHLQVLIDGRSIYQPALARIMWKDIPIDLEKISRIEIIRGPNTAMYGANSYLAVINIITFHPEDRLGGIAAITQGNHGISDGKFHYAKELGNFAFDISLNHHQDDGFEVNRSNEKRYDAYETSFFNADLIWHQSDTDYLRAEFGVADSIKQIDDLDPSEFSDYHNLDVQNSYGQFTLFKTFSPRTETKTQAFFSHSKIREDWRSCLPALLLSNELYNLYDRDPIYTDSEFLAALPDSLPPSSGDPETDALAQLAILRLLNNGGETVCGRANQDLKEYRTDIESQVTTQINDTVRLVAGLSFRNDKAQSESYFGGSSEKDIWRAFTNVELSPLSFLRFNLGAMYERDSLVGDTVTPRFATNWLYRPNQSLRLIYSKANRSPDLFENDNNRSYLLRDLTDLNGTPTSVNGNEPNALYYQHAQSSGNLHFEDIESWELGWYFRNADQTLEFDIKLFHDRLSNLLEGETSISRFSLTNTGAVDVSGVEGQLEWTLSRSVRLWATVSDVNIDNFTDDFYQKSSAKQTWSLNSFVEFDNLIQWTVGYYYYDDWFRVDFKRLDNSLGYKFGLGDTELHTRLTYQHRFDDNHLLDVRNVYTNPDKIFATVSLHW